MMGSLVDVSEKSKGFYWQVEAGREMVIGRVQECGICLPDAGASRRHCAISSGPDGLVVRDLGSANGTFVNGQRVTRATLKAGDRLRVGFTELEFRAAPAEPDAPTRIMAAAPAPARVEVPAPVARRRSSSGPAAAAPSRIPEAGLEFCSRCSGSIPRAMLASGRAKVVDGELLCWECLRRNSTRMAIVPVAERSPAASAAPAAPAARHVRPAAVRPAPTRAVRGASAMSSPTPSSTEPAAPKATVGQQIRAWAGLALTLFILAICLVQMPSAWLNFQRLMNSSKVGMQSVPLDEVDRSPLGLTLSCTLKPEGGEPAKVTPSAGIIQKFQYDYLVKKAKAAGGVAHFEVVYDTASPARSSLRDQLYGLPTMIVALIMLGWAAREGWQISRFYLRPAPAPARR